MQTKELESLIQFWKDSLAEHRLLLNPCTVYLVEQTIKRLEDARVIEHVADEGLFVARLNNGDWMAGKASYIYQLDITRDHYGDRIVSIAAALAEAIEKFVKEGGRNGRAGN